MIQEGVSHQLIPAASHAPPFIQQRFSATEPPGSLKFTGSPFTYTYMLKLLGLLRFAAPLGSGVKNLPIPGCIYRFTA